MLGDMRGLWTDTNFLLIFLCALYEGDSWPSLFYFLAKMLICISRSEKDGIKVFEILCKFSILPWLDDVGGFEGIFNGWEGIVPTIGASS